MSWSILIAAVFALILGVIVWTFTAGDNRNKPDRKNEVAPEAKPTMTGKPYRTGKPNQGNRPSETDSSHSNRNIHGADTLVAILDADEQLPAMPELKAPPPPKTSFKHASDEIISMTVNTEGQIAPIPYDNKLEQEFIKSLDDEIVINDDDPESLKKIKQNVIEAREAIKECMKQGMSVRAALEAHRDQVNFEEEMRVSAQREAKEILDSGDREGAAEFVRKINPELEKYGISAIEMPMTDEERRQKAIERVYEKKQKENQNAN